MIEAISQNKGLWQRKNAWVNIKNCFNIESINIYIRIIWEFLLATLSYIMTEMRAEYRQSKKIF